MKTAIVCYSFTNNNMILAEEIVARTGGTLFVIEERKTRSRFTIFLDLMFNRIPKVKDYSYSSERFDHYILIAPIWGGKIATPLKSFVLKLRSAISSYSFITLCGGVPNQKEKIVNELASLIHKEPLMVTELPLSDLPWHPKDILGFKLTREQMKFFEAQLRNFIEEIDAAPVKR